MSGSAYQAQNQDSNFFLGPNQRAELGNVPAHRVPPVGVLPVFVAVFLSALGARVGGQSAPKTQYVNADRSEKIGK